MSINFLHDWHVTTIQTETDPPLADNDHFHGPAVGIRRCRGLGCKARSFPCVRCAGKTKMGEKDKLEKAASEFVWNIVEIHSQLEGIHKSWAELLAITEPQWLILMAIDELDAGRGVSGIAVANKLRIHPAFVTNQTKKLEAMEFLIRETSPDDGRFLQMSLTQKARAEISRLSIKKESLNATMFDGLDEAALEYLNKRLALIAKNSRLASQKLGIGVL